jgi:hypothetical protein
VELIWDGPLGPLVHVPSLTITDPTSPQAICVHQTVDQCGREYGTKEMNTLPEEMLSIIVDFLEAKEVARFAATGEGLTSASENSAKTRAKSIVAECERVKSKGVEFTALSFKRNLRIIDAGRRKVELAMRLNGDQNNLSIMRKLIRVDKEIFNATASDAPLDLEVLSDISDSDESGTDDDDDAYFATDADYADNDE